MRSREDEALAQAAVTALTDQLALIPKPGLPDPSHRDHNTLRWSAKALAPGLAAMSAAARRTGAPTPALRTELGAIGRGTEHSVGLAGGGHRGALWTLGLLVAGAALNPREVMSTAKRLAAHTDRGAPRRPSRGSSVSAKYGAAGARGEARAGFPHVRRALDALAASRASGSTEPQARLDALLTVMSTLQDTELLYTTGPIGLRHVQAGAREVLEAGGTRTPAGAQALATLNRDLQERSWNPRGSAGLLAGALFLDSLPVSRPGFKTCVAAGSRAAGAAPAAKESGTRPAPVSATHPSAPPRATAQAARTSTAVRGTEAHRATGPIA